jgi:hypothetical protein
MISLNILPLVVPEIDAPSVTSFAASNGPGTRASRNLCSICYQHFVVHVSLLKSRFGQLADISSRSDCPYCDFLYSTLAEQVHAPLEIPPGSADDTKLGCWIRTYILRPTEVAVFYDGVTRFDLRVFTDEPNPRFDFWKMRNSQAQPPSSLH